MVNIQVDNMPARIGFAGTPEFAAQILQGLLDHGVRPCVIYTQPDRPRGRGKRLTAGPVKRLAEGVGIPCEQPATLRNPEAAARLRSYDLDLLLVAAYGLILPPAILATPRLGCLNVHASLLPRWRGAAPIERALMAGDTETGVCLMQMDKGLDTGAVHARCSIAIEPQATAASLESNIAALGIDALLALLPRLANAIPTPQPESGVTYAHKLTPDDSRINWHQPATAIDRQIRALTDRAPAFSELDGERIRVFAALVKPNGGAPEEPGTIVSVDNDAIAVACVDRPIYLTRIGLPRGKGKPLDVRALTNGYPGLFAAGRRFDPSVDAS